MSKIHTQTIVKRVRELATQYPEAKYVAPYDSEKDAQSCFYLTGKVENGPKGLGCIMGQALRGLVKLTEDDENVGIRKVLENKYSRVEFDSDDLNWLAEVQTNQDEGNTWGEAVDLADLYL